MSEERNENEIVKLDDQSLVAGQSIESQYRLAKMNRASGILPKQYTKPEQVLVAMQLAYELGLKPLSAMRQIAVINGTPSMYGDLPLSLCYASGKLEYIKETHYDKSGKTICEENQNVTAEVFGAKCVVKRKGEPEEHVSTFNMDQAQKANLISRSPVWKSYPSRMLTYRARSQALKDKFADCINGLSIAEYDYNINPNDPREIEIESVQTKAQSLTEKFVKNYSQGAFCALSTLQFIEDPSMSSFKKTEAVFRI